MKIAKKLDFSKAKFISAPTKKVEKYRKEIDIILEQLGHSEAYVTDESTIWDFSCSPKKINRVSKQLGFKIKDSMFLVEIAEKIKQKK
jgi:cupin superfamily acireductone dioxygenase involved in methionine salvage